MASPSAFPQRPRVPDVRMGVRAPVVRVLAVRVRCEEGGRDEARPPPRPPPPTELHKLY